MSRLSVVVDVVIFGGGIAGLWALSRLRQAGYQAVLLELDSLRRVPPTAAEVERVREQQRREGEVARKQNPWWTSVLRDRLEHGDDPTTVFSDDALIAGLTVEKLAAAAKVYLVETNRARFVLLPETKTP